MSTLHTLSIRQKLRLMVVFTSGAALLLAAAVFGVFGVMWFKKQTERELNAWANYVAFASEAPLLFENEEEAKKAVGYLGNSPSIIAGCLYLQAKTVVTNVVAGQMVLSTNVALRTLAEYNPARVAVPAAGELPSEGFHPKSLEYVTAAYSSGEEKEKLGMVYARYDPKVERRRLWECLGVVTAGVGLAVVITLLFAGRVQRVVTEPILELWQAARTVSEEKNYALRVKKHGHDELGQLVDGFNDMLEQI